MAWIIGIDEAGYGPNLGPFVMSRVACRLPDPLQSCSLWQLLQTAVRQARGKDERLHIDDSKAVYAGVRGLEQLERGVLAALWPADPLPATLADLVAWLCPDDHADLAAEAWYRGKQAVPLTDTPLLLRARKGFAEACTVAGVSGWQVRSVVVCPPRFNGLLDRYDSKSAVLTHALSLLLHHVPTHLSGDDPLAIFVDKHGGRNSYAALLQHALAGGWVQVEQESMERSCYHVRNLGRDVCLTFQPRADTDHFCAALASMVSKYLREVLMLEFNRFWQEHIPDLKPTAGYPGDAARFLAAIRDKATQLGITETALWRRK